MIINSKNLAGILAALPPDIQEYPYESFHLMVMPEIKLTREDALTMVSSPKRIVATKNYEIGNWDLEF